MNRERRCIVKLKDVSSYLHRPINLIGVVVEFSIPRRSSGPDCCTILKIIDQSQQKPELSVNVFMKNIDTLPQIRSHKDIILLCNVKIESYLGTASAVFHERKSSFALFEGTVSDDFTPFQVSPKFLSLDCDKDLVRRLRNWSQISSFDAGISEHVIALKDIKEGEFIDLVCEVLHVWEVSGEWMLFMWDGTDAPALCLKTIKYEQQNSISEDMEPVALPRNVLLGFPRVGTVLRVTVDEAYGNLGDNIRTFRGWVRIRNLQIKTESGSWKGILTPSTKIRPLCKDDDSVIERLRDYNERISKHGGLLPCQKFVWFQTMSGPFAILMDLLTIPPVPVECKCVADHLMATTVLYLLRTIQLQEYVTSVFKDAEVRFGGFDVLATKMNSFFGNA